MITKEYIKENLLKKDGNNINGQKLKWMKLEESTEDLYLIFNNLVTPICPVCCGRLRFIGFAKGYQTTCSIKCSKLHVDFRQNTKLTNKQKERKTAA